MEAWEWLNGLRALEPEWFDKLGERVECTDCAPLDLLLLSRTIRARSVVDVCGTRLTTRSGDFYLAFAAGLMMDLIGFLTPLATSGGGLTGCWTTGLTSCFAGSGSY